MSNNSVRQHVWELLKDDVILHGHGYAEDAVYPAYAPDSPPQGRFLVLRWGPTTPGVATAHSGDLEVWAYNREANYAPITDALRRCREILAPLPGIRLATAAVLGVDWRGAGGDLFDDAYKAYVRSEGYIITASGN